jgi:hypothetical protein
MAPLVSFAKFVSLIIDFPFYYELKNLLKR